MKTIKTDSKSKYQTVFILFNMLPKDLFLYEQIPTLPPVNQCPREVLLSSQKCPYHFHLQNVLHIFINIFILKIFLIFIVFKMFCSLLRIFFKTDRRIRDIVSFLLWTSNPLINQDITRDNTRLAYITIISDTPQPTLEEQP